ncbi:hypothetical protein G8770_13420 [Aestuariicella hydrocarbonica]|uniref:Uncharacterized protein n=1 Tax=Pseudomaricurvus hydrocarbonicus TaxID=1470433 RepID=A0A9E5JTI2_9GAMM|nr:hypothetical protein [Aestuariicella hydrocarbonica]NHO66543.1 hypothetical protein [Aestuariicella hydrocarbonica]
MSYRSHFLALPQYLTPALAAALLSTLSTLIIISLSGSINADATQYLIAADTFKVSGWDAAEEIYPRPFYSVLIGGLSQITHTSSFVSAQLLDISLLALLGYAFVKVIQALGGDRRAQWIGACLIVLLPTLADYRDYLIRDFGYWAFMLLALNALIRFQANARLLQAGQWCAYSGIAMLFRPEAVLLLVLVPTALLLPSPQSLVLRLKLTAKLYGLLLAGLLIALAIGLSTGLQLQDKFIELALSPLLEQANQLAISLPKYTQVMASEILNRHSEEHAALSVSLVLSGIFVATLLSALTPIIVFLGLYLWKKGQLRWPRNTPYLMMHIVLAGILINFLLFKHFMQARYMLLTALLLLIPLCIGLSREYDNIARSKVKKGLLFTLAMLVLLDNHISTSSHEHDQDSLAWLQQHSSQDDWIYTNDHQLAYFSGLTFDWNDILYAKRRLEKTPASRLYGYDFVALNVGRKDAKIQAYAETLSALNYHQRAKFSNNRGDQIIIFESPDAHRQRESDQWQSAHKQAFHNPNRG